MGSKAREEYHVRSVQRALKILDCFTDESPYLGVSEISQKLGLHKSTIHALLVTIEDEGFLKKDEAKNKYFLTYKFFRLGNIVSDNISIKSVAKPFMEQLCKDTQESVALNIRDNGKRLVLAVVEQPHPIRLFVKPGQLLPLHSSAAGKILLLDLSKEEIEEIIEKEGLEAMTPNTITDKDTLFKELDKVKEAGYATCNGEGYWDAGSVGVPLYDYNGTIVASLILYGPLQNYKGEKLEYYIEHIKKSAESISRLLGFNGFIGKKI